VRPHGASRGPLVALAALILAVLIAQVASAGGSPEGGAGALQRQIDQLRAKLDRTAEAATKKKRKRGPRGRRGPPGPIGPIGPIGPKGDAGATKVLVRTQAKQIPVGATDSVNVGCANGERAVGGGGGLTGFSDNGDGVVISRPLANGAIPDPGDVPNGWTVFVHNAGIGEDTAKVYAICSSP
jgi:hypothetical protein